MSNRETQTLVTSRGHKILHYAWISGKEFNAIQNVYLKSVKMNFIDGKPTIDGFSANSEELATNKMIEVMVISIDEKTDNIVDTIENMPVDEYDEIVAALKNISDKKK